MKTFAAILLLLGTTVLPMSAATLTFGTSAPTPTGSAAISNWTGATFDADNVGGSATNANGSPNNGPANDATTYVSNNRAAQGETFTTGSNAGGYKISAITVRAAGYTNNTASGTNTTSWGLNSTASTFTVRIGQISGTTFIPYTIEYAASGGTGNPGVSSSANGSGTYLTFTLKAPIVLLPNTVYAFDIGTTGDYFEMLGIRDGTTGGNPYATGTAYTSGASGAGAGAITTQTGDRVFMVDMAPYTPPTQGAFVHPGLLNTDADFVRMRNNVALGVEPWVTGYNALTASWLGSTPTRAPSAVATITRSSTTNNTPILYKDVAAAYGSALRWKISGDTAYADEAVRYLNAWGYTLMTVNGDSNANLCNLYGYQFACVAEIMRTYPGWAPADFAQFQTMMTTIFYPLANNFLTGHNGTAYDHYWANWDLCAMDDIYAIGVLTDNPAMTNQAITYFKSGLGTGCIDRTVNFIHPGLLGQGQESGRDQGHATLDLSELASFCQMTWNQGNDMFGYENNRVLSMAEYAAKYNLLYEVPFAPYSNANGNSGGWRQEVISSATRGSMGHTGWATFYNHYVNIKGLAAPYTQMGTTGDGTYWYFGGDDPGWDYLTTAVAPIATGANPSLTAIVTAQQPVLSWWGSAYATSYNVLRSTTGGSGYTTIASGLTTNTYTDTSVVPGTTYYYVVNGTLISGTTGNSNEATAIIGTSLYAQLKFDETSGTAASDSTGNGWAGTLVNGATWTTGTISGAVNLSSASSQYVNLPNSVASDLSDFTISAWVNLSSISTWARIFDIGYSSATSTNERYMDLTASNGSVPRFAITHSGATGEEWINSNIPLPTNQWAHIAVTMNGPIATLYINGNAVGQNRNMFTTPNRLPGGINYAYIGKSGYSADPYLNGKVDDFRIYRGPLSVGAVYTLATGLQPATPPSSAPTNLAVTALAGNQNSLSWTAAAGAANYTVLRATSANGPYSIVATIVPGTTYIDTGLTAGTTYYYEVDGANTGGDGAVSTASSSVVALPPLPSVPAGLTANTGSATTALLNWTAAANAYSYNVKRSLTSGGPYATIASGLTATTYTDTGLTTGTTYYYVVSSVNTAAESANSTENNTTPSDLLVHLRFDETSGATSADATGNGWNATLVSAPTFVPGTFGNALNFASASKQYATLGSGVVSTTNDFTISVWVNMSSFANWARAYDFGTGTSNYMFLAPQGIAAGKPRFAIRSNGSAEQDLDSSVAITTGTWTQITVTLTGGVSKMYINGVLVGTNSAMTLTPASLGSTNLNYLGRSQFSADPYLNGAIDDLRINGHAFTAAQVAANLSPSPVPPTGLGNISNDGSMTLNWAVDETATTYNVKRATVSGGPYTTVGTGLSTPTFLDTGLTNGTTYYYVVSAVNWNGESANSTETAGTAFSLAWAAQDIGPVGATGSSSVSGGTVTVNGSGGDIWGGADAFQFRSVPITGNCIMTARVLSVTNTNVWAKAGVMIRDTLDANAIDAAMLVTPTTAQGIQWQSKNTTGGSSTYTEVYGITAPYWVRLVRTGTTIQGYRSPDGVNWTSQGSATLASLGATASVGLAVSSHVSGTLCTAVFDNVSVNWVPDAPSVTATPAPFQVALNWSSVPNATSYNVYSSSVSGGPYTLTASGLTSTSYVQTGLTSGAPIYYVVTATNIVGEGLGSDEANVAPIVPPAAPIGFASTGGTGQVALSWTASSGATSYNVKRSATSGGPYSNIATGVTTASYTDTSLANGTSYYYVVSGVDSAGEGVNSTEAGSITLPVAPAGLSAVGSTNQVALTWSSTTGAASYSILSSTTIGGPYTTIASGITTTSYTNTGLANGTAYYYVVAAVNASGSSPNSTEAGTMTLPGAPAGLSAVASANQATLTWSATMGAASYTILSSTTNGGPYNTTVATGVTTTSYINTGLATGTAYYYVVEAVDATGTGPNSAQSSALTLPAAPTGFSAVANSDQVTLTWSATTGTASYTIGQSTTSGGPYTTIASGITATSYTATGLTNGTTYYYVVAAVDATGTGANSAQVSSVPATQSLYWDTTTAAGLGNGSGNWDINTTPAWSTSSAGTSNPLLTYLNDDNAYFQTAGIMTATIPGGTTIKVGSVNQAVNGTATTITGGTLQIDTNSGITNGVGSGNQALTINSPIVLNSANVTINNATTAGSMTLGGAISQIGTGRGITLTGPGSVILSGVNTFTGATTVSSGTLQFNGTGAMSSSSVLSLANGTTLTLASNTTGTFTPGTASGGGNAQFTGAITTLNVGQINSGTNQTITLGGTTVFTSGNQTLNVNGSNGDSLTLNAVALDNSGASTTFNFSSGTTLNLGAITGGLYAGQTYGTIIFTGAGTANATGAITQNTANRSLAMIFNQTGTVTLSGSNNLRNNSNGSDNVYTYVTVNNGTVNFNHANAINTTSGSNTSFTNQDGVALAGPQAWFYLNQTRTATPTIDNTSGSALTLNGGYYTDINGSFNFGGSNSLSLNSNAVYLTTATPTITASGTGTLTIPGVINGSFGLIKAGTGVLALSGANTYTGATTVSAGTLRINGSIASGSAVTVSSGATLGGTGTVNGATTVASGGILAPGASSAGTLTFAGGLNLNGGSVLNVGLGSSSDKVAMSAGTYTAPGSGTVTLNISSLTGFGVGTYNLITGATGISAGSFTLGATPSGYTYALSASSGTLSITVSAPGAPTGLAVDGFTVGNNLTWAASSGATSYSVLRSTGGAYTTIASGVSGTAYTDSTAVNGTSYTYEVTATNLGGTSAASTASSVTTVAASAYLKFDEGSGTAAADATGNGWAGTLVNTPAWVAGRSINAVSLNGTNQYVALPAGVVSSLTSCTIAMWVNLDAATVWSRLFDFGTGTTKYMFLTANSGSTVRFAITTNGNGSEQRINGTSTFPIGGWHHVAVTLTGAVGTLYIDGTQVGQNTAMTLNPSSLGSTTLNYIGRSQFSADPYLNGDIDEVRIYSSALSATQISSLMTTSPLALQSAPTSLAATAGSQQVALTWTVAPGAAATMCTVPQSAEVPPLPWPPASRGRATPIPVSPPAPPITTP